MQITFNTNLATGVLISGNSFNDTTDAATFTTTGGGTFVWATHLTTESLTANGSGGWTGTLLESGTDTVASSGESTISVAYTATTGTGGESRKFSYYVRDAAGNDSNVITETFTVNAGYSGPTYQGLGSIVKGNTGTAAWPTHTTGDIGIAIYVTRQNLALPTTPTGWTLLGSVDSGSSGSSFARTAIWYRVATSASETGIDTTGYQSESGTQIITARGGTTVSLVASSGGQTTSVSLTGGAVSSNSLVLAAVGVNPTATPGTDQISSWTNSSVSLTDRGGGIVTHFSGQYMTELATGELDIGATIGATTATLTDTGHWAGMIIQVN